MHLSSGWDWLFWLLRLIGEESIASPASVSFLLDGRHAGMRAPSVLLGTHAGLHLCRCQVRNSVLEEPEIVVFS